MDGAQEAPMTEQAEDPIKPPVAKTRKSRARAARPYPDAGLAASIATARYAQEILGRSPALDAIRYLPVSAVVSRTIAQVSTTDAVRDLVPRSPFLDVAHHLHHVARSTRIAELASATAVVQDVAADLVRLKPVLDAAAKYQQTQVAR